MNQIKDAVCLSKYEIERLSIYNRKVKKYSKDIISKYNIYKNPFTVVFRFKAYASRVPVKNKLEIRFYYLKF